MSTQHDRNALVLTTTHSHERAHTPVDADALRTLLAVLLIQEGFHGEALMLGVTQVTLSVCQRQADGLRHSVNVVGAVVT